MQSNNVKINFQNFLIDCIVLNLFLFQTVALLSKKDFKKSSVAGRNKKKTDPVLQTRIQIQLGSGSCVQKEEKSANLCNPLNMCCESASGSAWIRNFRLDPDPEFLFRIQLNMNYV